VTWHRDMGYFPNTRPAPLTEAEYAAGVSSQFTAEAVAVLMGRKITFLQAVIFY
jgi:hypothetical protein